MVYMVSGLKDPRPSTTELIKCIKWFEMHKSNDNSIDD